eukprot:CAMPEP_0168570702 /NCGR_PEP_ID=MMETSP0413-20121227/16891_1 /TAXON_ID=136452 /ORGANISM="Filamoeba nolandi, Strain NC-AS-23-1" /LENGTH=71 /DNA_ID=CAMNT_0008603401 /DNA_START=72 /DNA_END=287 /DNA_ORIENTATION=+
MEGEGTLLGVGATGEGLGSAEALGVALGVLEVLGRAEAEGVGAELGVALGEALGKGTGDLLGMAPPPTGAK